MKKVITWGLCLALIFGFIPACGDNQTVRFQLKIAYSITEDYYICAQGQEIKYKLKLEDYTYTEELSGNVKLRTYDVTFRYPAEVTVREDGRSFWTLYVGYVLPSSEYFPYILKNIGIRSGHTVVEANVNGNGKVFYDTVKTVYSDGDFTLYANEGMGRGDGNMLHDTQFVFYERDGERVDCGSVLPWSTIELLGQNTPKPNGEVETWFSVISGAEGVSEVDRFCVTTKTQEPQPQCTLTYADLPDVISEEGAKWLDDSEFAADGIKPDTDVAAMKAAFGEPLSSWGEYDSSLNYRMYEYDGVRFSFLTGIRDDEWKEVNRTYRAVFTKNLLNFPRGIKIGDDFEEVLKKFPQEMDYKDDKNENLFYGDYWRKDKLGWGKVSIRNENGNTENGVWISAICDEYWPMLQVHFTNELIADKIIVQFSPYPWG